MFWEKFIALFKKSTNASNKNKKVEKGSSVPRRTVEPSHISDLGEYKIDVQLRQLPKEYRYISDVLLINPRSRTGYSQLDHILITPYGLFVIETKNYEGSIRGKRMDKHWRVNGKFNMPNPLRQNYGHIKALEAILNEYQDIKFVSVISFTKRCTLYIDPDLRQVESDEFVVYDIKFTEFIERKLRRLKNDITIHQLSESDMNGIFELVILKNITDPDIRAQHIQKAGGTKAIN